jgi:hypothetical protein
MITISWHGCGSGYEEAKMHELSQDKAFMNRMSR